MNEFFDISLQYDVIFLFTVFVAMAVYGWWIILSSILKWIQKNLEKHWIRQFEEEENSRN